MAKDFKNTLKLKAKEAITNSYSYVEKIKQHITILEELRSFIPPLLPQELEQLRTNLLKDGCKDPLLVWETTQNIVGISDTPEAAYVLVDGHNRYQLCTELGLNFNVQLLAFDRIEQVKEYMIDLQLGRRNLNPQQASYLRGLRYQNEKQNVGNNFNKENDASNGQNDHLVEETTTAQKLAEEFKVSEKTIRRDAAFAAGLEKLAPQLRNDILAGNQKVDKAVIQKLGKTKVQNPISSTEELTLLTTPEKTIQPEQLSYKNLLTKINYAFNSKKQSELEAAQEAFEDFKASIKWSK